MHAIPRGCIVSEPLYAFCVAVVGDRDLMTGEQLERLLSYLVNRHHDTRKIVLLGTGGHGPELMWCQNRGWTLQVIPRGGNRVKQDCDFVVHADALVVLGDPAPWRRLISLCNEARIPVRIYRERPKQPPPRHYPPEG
jgi:hypothetical protein